MFSIIPHFIYDLWVISYTLHYYFYICAPSFYLRCSLEVLYRSHTHIPINRHSHAAVVHKDSMYIFGGYDGSYRSDFHEFKFTNSSWVLVPAVGRPPRARYRATCVVYKDTMILFAGHDGTRHLADTHVFDFESRIWSTLATEGPSPIPRDSHVSVVHSNSMLVRI